MPVKKDLKQQLFALKYWYPNREIFKGVRGMHTFLDGEKRKFWKLWRESKEEIRKLGFHVWKDGSDWMLRYKRALPTFCYPLKTITRINGTINKKLLMKQRLHVKKLCGVLAGTGSFVDGSETGVGKTIAASSIAKLLGLKLFIICRKNGKNAWRFWANYLGSEVIGITHYEEIKTGKTEYLKKITCKDKQRKKDYYFEWLLDVEETLLVFDEVHKCRDSGNLNTELLVGAKKQGFYIGMLSATLVESPLQFGAIGYVLGIVKNYHKGSNEFREWAAGYGCFEDEIYVKDFKSGKSKKKKVWTFDKEDKEALVRLHKKIFPKHGSRLTIKDLGKDFPEQQLVAVPYTMDNSKKINKLYKQLKKDIADLSKQEKKRKETVTLILLARQKIELLKVPTIIELVDEYLGSNKSIAIFVNFRNTLKHLSEELKISCVVHGGQVGKKGEKERDKAMQDFQADNERVICLTCGAGGESISLHDLNGTYPRVSLISPPWSGNELIQVLGRVRRAKAKTPVYQRLLYAAETVEEEVAKIVMSKADCIQAINDGDLCGQFAEYY
jgi:superfamily II DNA or RNA helicase